ncbi:response regulator [Vibrio sp. SCSIO 43136]|uniref:hybrid sensor histidine kinase/response regulator n=1 Tax=Vibrio sp. SCSIO 43136 TaxID=2819101 RepID=UPI002074B141|nr:response regulator [Vibrio sp. SCSIO 43136]USD66897.1 response regulator [Vibrio sp. SCSIO 43136]
MKLIPKIILAITFTTVASLGVMAWYSWHTNRISLDTLIDQQLAGKVALVKSIVDEQQRDVLSIAKLVARNRAIATSLDLDDSSGINQALNDIPAIFSDIRYVLVIDNYRTIFAATTRDGQGNKIAGEELLLASIDDLPKFSRMLADTLRLSDPVYDPYLKELNLPGAPISQWLVVPIKKSNRTVGWVAVSFAWQDTYQVLLDTALDNFIVEHSPVSSISVLSNDLQVELLTSQVASTSSDLISRHAPIKFATDSFDLRVTFDRELAYEPLDKTRNRLIIVIAVGALLISLLLVVVLRKLVVQPISEITKELGYFSRADFDRQITGLRQDEIGDVGRSINQMANALKSSTTSIDRLDLEIQEKQKVLREKEQASRSLEAIFDTAADGIIIINSQGSISSFNKAAQRIFGYTEREAIGNNVAMLMESDLAQVHQSFIRGYLNTGEGKFIGKEYTGRELIGRRKNGELFPVVLSVAKVETEQGIQFSGLIRDNTEVQRNQQELIEAKENALSAVKAKSEFLAVMSHEIRTPMNGILGMLELLLETKMSDEQHHHTHLAHASAQSLLEIINDILDFSKIEAGKLELEQQPFDIRRMLDDLLETMSFQNKNPNVELILNTTGIESSMVNGDLTRIRQIFVNLIGNALKFTEQGEVLVEVAISPTEDAQLLLEAKVKDSGIGIAQDKLESLFAAFTQADASTTRNYGGTGLGLAICKKLVEAMDGDISVTSVVGLGSQFSFRVKTQPSDQAVQIIPNANLSKLNILVVDDNETNREVMRSQLDHWGADVTLAESKDQAVEISQQQPADQQFDIAFLDMQMPGSDGVDLAKALKADEHTRPIKLILMTSNETLNNIQDYRGFGFSGYFAKPATTSDLINALNILSTVEDGETVPLITHNVVSSYVQQKEQEVEPVTGLNILVVEDNKVNQMVVKTILERAGESVTIAENGQVAIDLLTKHQDFDLVLMDCQMPVLDGFEATRQIRQGAAGDLAKRIIIIAMTANAMTGDRELCLEAGMDDYLTKPVNKRRLYEVLNQWSNAANKNEEFVI